MLHLIAILISENIFLWHVAPTSIIFVTFAVFVAIFPFQSPKPVTALIICRLDYCSLLYNIASKDILKLQCIQNCLARVVTRSPQFSHSSPLLKSLHWLPVQFRIIFKLCTIVYQTLSSGEPSYLIYILSLAPNPTEFRSSGFHLLSNP